MINARGRTHLDFLLLENDSQLIYTALSCLFFHFLFFYNSAALGRVCIKLVVVMGITWILDVLSWVHTTLDGERHAFWIVSDLINALHGVFIFIVVGCQPQVNKYIYLNRMHVSNICFLVVALSDGFLSDEI